MYGSILSVAQLKGGIMHETILVCEENLDAKSKDSLQVHDMYLCFTMPPGGSSPP